MRVARVRPRGLTAGLWAAAGEVGRAVPGSVRMTPTRQRSRATASKEAGTFNGAVGADHPSKSCRDWELHRLDSADQRDAASRGRWRGPTTLDGNLAALVHGTLGGTPMGQECVRDAIRFVRTHRSLRQPMPHVREDVKAADAMGLTHLSRVKPPSSLVARHSP